MTQQVQSSVVQDAECLLSRGLVIGMPVTIGSVHSVASHLLAKVRDGASGYVCVANVHMLVTARRAKHLASVLRGAEVVTSDGMPLVWTLKRQGHREAERVAGPDLVPQICELSALEQVPVYFYGGTSETLEAMRERLVQRFPGVRIVGMEAPPMLPEQPEVDDELVQRLRSSGARLIFVGLGCPKQEYWMAAYSPHVSAIMLGVGAAFDFLAGSKSRAPSWMQRTGLEWLFRLLCEPRRLWRRYAMTNGLFVYYSLSERFNWRHRGDL